MSILTGIVNTLSGGLVETIGDTVKKFVTTDKDRLEAQQTIEKQVQDYILKLSDQLQTVEAQLTARQANDMASDSWLSKNIRPLTMAFLSVSYIILAFGSVFGLDPAKLELLRPWVSSIEALLQTVFVFYFGSRGFEKITQMVSAASVTKTQGAKR
jgi:hypothetical protein